MFTSSPEVQKAYKKAEKWSQEVEKRKAGSLSDRRVVDVTAAINLTMRPQARRGTFPGLTRLTILTSDEARELLMDFPSITLTAVVSLLCGVAVGTAFWSRGDLRGALRRFAGRQRPVIGAALTTTSAVSVVEAAPSSTHHLVHTVESLKPLFRSLRCFLRRLARCLVAAVTAVIYVRFLRRRYPRPLPVCRAMDCSSSPAGPCRVTDRVLFMTNSHAGTHADTPYHFMRERVCTGLPSLSAYSGDVVAIDLSSVIAALSPTKRAITAAMLEAHLSSSFPSIAEARRLVYRLVLVTRCYKGGVSERDEFDKDFAYLIPEAVEYLQSKFPQLLLVAIDTPSVDHATASPICEYSHGSLFSNGIAILENLDCAGLRTLFDQSKGTIEGSVVTVFNPALEFEDSCGCSVLFIPLAR